MNSFAFHCVALICLGSISLAEPPTNEYLPPSKGYDYPKPAKPFPTTSYTPSAPAYTPSPSYAPPSYSPAPSYPSPSRPSPTYGAPTPSYSRPTPPPYRPSAPSPTYGPAPPAPVYGQPTLENAGSGNYPTYNEEGHLPGHVHVPSAPYEVNYAVKDDYYGTDYSHNAVSNGDQVTGEYRVQLPDGRLQIVKYVADWKTGFHADVSYQGEAQYPAAQPGPKYGAPTNNVGYASAPAYSPAASAPAYSPAPAYTPAPSSYAPSSYSPAPTGTGSGGYKY
uniref:Pro-resilin n=1 Tax=Cacopsylla melanoneura TaxID=428564 RepID=A0A8D9AHX6_9HEMI